MKPVLVIHGGAGSQPPTRERALVLSRSLEAVIKNCYPLLLKGQSALAVAVEAVRLLEDDPLYNAGLGSKIQSDGKIRMSAAVMDGQTRRFSGCVNVESVRNPILLAKLLLKEKDRVLSGPGARAFAKNAGLKFRSALTPRTQADWKNKRAGKSGTVGAVALDKKGRLAAATSTGGRGYEFPFRVSDSPTVAGNFASSMSAVSATGIGEEIVDAAAAAAIVTLTEAGFSLSQAVEKVLGSARKRKAQFGVIAVSRAGDFVAQTTTKHLIWAAQMSDHLIVHP